MRVAIVGGCSQYSLEGSYLRAFPSLEHDVFPFDFEKAYAAHFLAQQRIPEKIARSAIARSTGVEMVKALTSAKPDLILIMKGRFIQPESLAALKKALPDIPLLNFNPDSPWEPANSTKWLLDSIPMYDIHLTWSKVL